MVRAEVLRQGLPSSRSIEHPAQPHAIDDAALHANADDATRALVHHDENPVRAQDRRFTSKQIETPQTVLRVTEGREPGRPRRVRFRPVTNGENSPHHILVDGIPKAKAICCAIRGQPQVGFRCFMSRTAAITSWLGPFGPGFLRALGENSRRYFRFFSVRWRLKSVEGFSTIADRISRPGRMRSAQTPATMRSPRRRWGARFRERLRMSSCCLTSTDSATTERAPPGPTSWATVAIRCRNSTARSRMHVSVPRSRNPRNAHAFSNS